MYLTQGRLNLVVFTVKSGEDCLQPLSFVEKIKVSSKSMMRHFLLAVGDIRYASKIALP